MSEHTKQAERFLQEIKGMPLTVWVTITFLRLDRTGIQELTDMLDSTRPTIKKALRKLSNLDIVDQLPGVRYKPFVLTELGKQLEFAETMYKFFTYSSSSLSLIDLGSKDLKIKATTTMLKFYTSQEQEILDHLKSFGVWDIRAEEIAIASGWDLDLIKEHFKYADTKLAIYRILNNVDPYINENSLEYSNSAEHRKKYLVDLPDYEEE